jgi:hypothetical protein
LGASALAPPVDHGQENVDRDEDEPGRGDDALDALPERAFAPPRFGA